MHLEGLVADLHAFEQLLLDIGRGPRINRFFGVAAERVGRIDERFRPDDSRAEVQHTDADSVDGTEAF